MSDYEKDFLLSLAEKIASQPDPRKPKEIANDLQRNHQWSSDEYIGKPGRRDRRVHVPNETNLFLPGRTNAIEQWASGHTEQLLIQRMGLTEDKARKVISILKRRGFRITP